MGLSGKGGGQNFLESKLGSKTGGGKGTAFLRHQDEKNG